MTEVNLAVNMFHSSLKKKLRYGFYGGVDSICDIIKW